MKNIAKITAVIILLAAVLSAVTAAAESGATYKSTEDEIVKLLNAAREKADMDSLEQDELLTELARKKAQEMADKRLDVPEFTEGIKQFLKANDIEATAHTYSWSVGKTKPAEIVTAWSKQINFDRDTWAAVKTKQIGVGAAKSTDGTMYVVCLYVNQFGEEDKTVLENEVIRLINAERKKHGLSLVEKADELMKVARTKTQDMADNDYCAHVSPTHGSPAEMVRKYAETIAYSGEAIAAGQMTASDVVKAWLDSPAHKAILLDKSANCMGIGVTMDAKGSYIWSLLMGKK